MDKFYPPNFIGYIPLPDGRPAAGGTIIACRTGTDILAPIYDENGVRIDGSALQIDSHGQAHFLLDPAITYRLKIIMPPDDILQPTAVYDNVRVANVSIEGMENPMASIGDMIVGGANGAPERLSTDGALEGYALKLTRDGNGNLVQNWAPEGGGDYIPLSGTEVGHPVVGPIELVWGDSHSYLRADGVTLVGGNPVPDWRVVSPAVDANILFNTPCGYFRISPNWCGIQSYSTTPIFIKSVAGKIEIKSEEAYTDVIGSFSLSDTGSSDRRVNAILASGNVTSIISSSSASHALLTADAVQKLIELNNPMTAIGDVIIGGTGGAPTRLALGANGRILTSDGTTAGWKEPDGKVRTNVSDTAPDYLENTLEAGTGISIALSGRKLVFSVTGGGGGMVNPMDDVGQMIFGFIGGAPYKLSAPSDNQQVMGVAPTGQGNVPDWKPAGNILVKALAQKYDGSSSGFTKGSIIYGGDNISVGEAGVLNKAEAKVLPIGTEDQALFVDSSGVPAWKNLPATMQENYALLDSTSNFATTNKSNRIYASKVVSNFTAKRAKLGFFHKAGTLGNVLLGVYDNSGALMAATALFTPGNDSLEQVCWEDTLSSFQMIAGEEYWFVAYFTENNWQLNIDALGMEKSSAFDVNFIGSAVANALTVLPATLPTLTYETLAFYIAAK